MRPLRILHKSVPCLCTENLLMIGNTMQHINLRPEKPADIRGQVVVLGYFDGVHTAHRHLIELARARADESGTGVMVWTFSYLSKSGKGSLTTRDEKTELFRTYGVDSVVFEDFSDFRDLDGETFFTRYIADRLSPSAILCGYNFRFGRGAAWGAPELSSLSQASSVPCIVADEFTIDGITVSSTAIRDLLAAGDTEAANRMLGYEYSVTSEIEHGKMIGRTMGIPTINQTVPADKFRPACGVYAVRCGFPETGETYDGVANLGYRPTLSQNRKNITLETHLFGYSGAAYGSVVRTSFLKKIRDEIRFPDKTSLSEQIRKDEKTAFRYFKDFTDEKN